MDYVELRRRLINWGRIYKDNGREPHGTSPTGQIMRLLGYLPEYASKSTLTIDYEDARIIDRAFYSLPLDSGCRLYIGKYYCTSMGVSGFCRYANLPRHLFDELERRSLQKFQGILDAMENPDACGTRQQREV